MAPHTTGLGLLAKRTQRSSGAVGKQWREGGGSERIEEKLREADKEMQPPARENQVTNMNCLPGFFSPPFSICLLDETSEE